jgi:sortase A
MADSTIRRRLRLAGGILMVGGVLLLALVGLRIVQTDSITSRAQARLRREVSALGFVAYEVPHHLEVSTAQAHDSPGLIPGRALGYVRIPRIHLDMVFVQGVSGALLQTGPGHYPATPMPGQSGNVAIAGHRTTYLHPFWALDAMRPGDLIMIQTREGSFTYVVQWEKVVLPTDLWVLAPTRWPSLTLTTCNPRFSASERLVIRAVLRPDHAQAQGMSDRKRIDA